MSGSGKTLGADEVLEKIDSDTISNAEENGIDVRSVVNEKIEEHSGYAVATVARISESAIARMPDASSATVVSGILCGSRDRFGKNWPRRHALVRSNGEHIEASSWSGSIQTSDGGEIQFPAGSAVDIRLEHDEKYDSYEAKQIDSVTKLTHPDLSQRLAGISKRVSEIGRADEYETVVIAGTLRYINPQTVFEDGDPKGDGEIMMADDRGNPKPHFEAVLEEEGDTRVRAHVERQRYGEPFFAIEDFDKIIHDAYSGFDSPDEQAQFVGTAMRGVDVAIMGNVNKVNQSRNNGEVTKYVDIGVAGMVQISNIESDPEPVEETPTEEVSEEQTEQEPEQEEDETESEGLGDFEDIEHDPQPDPKESENQMGVDEVTDKVKQYVDIVGMDLVSVTVDTIKENTAIEAPDSVISAAIDRLIAADEPEPVDIEDRLRNSETGQIECPQSNCYYNCGSLAELYGHVATTHIPGDENPEEWIEETA